jgi:hypothetical protein
MTRSRALLCIFGLLLGGACGGSSGSPPVTEVGRSIAGVTMHTLVLQNEGGVPASPPPVGSNCAAGAVRHSLATASLQLKTTRCVGSATMPYQEVASTKLITTQQNNDLRLLLDQLVVVAPDNDVCLSNQPILAVYVYTAAGDQKYVDDASQCQVRDKPLLERSAISVALSRLDSISG